MSEQIARLLKNSKLVDNHRPWPRYDIENVTWMTIGQSLADGVGDLLGLWGDRGAVYMALRMPDPVGPCIVSSAIRNSEFPSIGKFHAPAIRLERAVRDLYGYAPVTGPDRRPWLDHGAWGMRAPLGSRFPTQLRDPASYDFSPVSGEGLHQIPVGPVHAGIIEPGHFRFTANGETVARLEERLGYVHKGIDGAMSDVEIDQAARVAARVSGDSTVAYSFAFARAVEAALDIDPPIRAKVLRGAMAELERVANHFGDIGAICNDASFSLMHAHCGILRERTLRAADACFGHRLMMDRIVPGGVAADLASGGATAVRELLDEAGRLFPQLVELYDNTASLMDRTATTGILSEPLAKRFGAGGYVGRGSGRAFDARKALRYPPYDVLTFDTPVLAAGDVNARVWIRIREVEQSLSLIGQILASLPAGAIAAASPTAPPGGGNGDGTCEGMALVEGFRGDVLIWLRIENGRVARCHLRDPSWFQWPLLEAVIEGNIVADFPLCNKSFNCSYSGHDL
jgi:Ni,Fe-hydrogenase III large subunit